MIDFVTECKNLGIDTRIARCVIDVGLQEVQEISGESFFEFSQLNQIEELGIEKWIKATKDKDDEENPIVLELLLEIYKKLEKIERRIFFNDEGLLKLPITAQTHYIGHGVLCFQEDLTIGSIYYARIDLPIFPSKLIPFYAQMVSANIAKIVKMGATHTKSYDNYVAECERIEIREKRMGHYGSLD